MGVSKRKWNLVEEMGDQKEMGVLMLVGEVGGNELVRAKGNYASYTLSWDLAYSVVWCRLQKSTE